MTDAEAFLRRVVSDFGAIRRVTVDESDRVALSVVDILFDAGGLAITAIAKEDTITVSDAVDTGVAQFDVSDVYPWSSLIGGLPIWIGTLQISRATGMAFSCT